MENKKFGRYTVIKRMHGVKYPAKEDHFFLCKCDCSNERIVRKQSLIQGTSKSCGCLQREIISKAHKTHGMSKTKEYKTWKYMMTRCHNKNYYAYNNYGGRGIEVCKNWHKFINFYNDMGKKPSDEYSIERIDVNKGYNKENCKWLLKSEQSSNRRNNIIVSYKGKNTKLYDLKEKSAVEYKTLNKRLYRGWDIERALNTPNIRNS